LKHPADYLLQTEDCLEQPTDQKGQPTDFLCHFRAKTLCHAAHCSRPRQLMSSARLIF
jgi:hypothetical protein